MVKVKKVLQSVVNGRVFRATTGVLSDVAERFQRLNDYAQKQIEGVQNEINRWKRYDWRFTLDNLSIRPFDARVDRFEDSCNVIIQHRSTVAYGLLSIVDRFYYRKPDCRLLDEPSICGIFPLHNVSGEDLKDYFERPDDPLEPEIEGDGKRLYVTIQDEDYAYETHSISGPDDAGYVWIRSSRRINAVEFPENLYLNANTDLRPRFELVYAIVKTETAKTQYSFNYNVSTTGWEDSNGVDLRKEDEIILFDKDKYAFGDGVFITARYHEFEKYSPQNLYFKHISNYGIPGDPKVYSLSEPLPFFTIETPNEIITRKPTDETYIDGIGNLYYVNIWSPWHNTDVRARSYINQSFGDDYNCDPNKKKPPPPPKNMRCCPDNSQLLKEILKIVRENKAAIGVQDYPVTVPTSLINKNNIEPGDKKLTSLTQFLGWYVERFDEVLGQFEIPIEIEDSDLVTEGNQKLKITLPNIAESIGEMFMMLLSLTINNDVILNMNTRILAETGSDKQQNFKSYMLLEAITEYLGFKYKTVNKDLPLTFTPEAPTVAKILQNKTYKVSCIEFDDKINLPKQMTELLQSAAITRAVHWQKLDPKQDITKQLFGSILNSKDLISQLLANLDLGKLEKELNEINKKQENGDNPSN